MLKAFGFPGNVGIHFTRPVTTSYEFTQLASIKKKKKEKERKKNLWESFYVYITKLLGLYTDNLKPAKHMCRDGKI